MGSSTSSIFFSPLNWVFVVIFNWALQKSNCWVCLHSVYFCCTIKTASHLHLLDYTEISDYWTGRKSSNCEVSSCSFLFLFFFPTPPKEWAENFRGERKRKKPFESFNFFCSCGGFLFLKGKLFFFFFPPSSVEIQGWDYCRKPFKKLSKFYQMASIMSCWNTGSSKG